MNNFLEERSGSGGDKFSNRKQGSPGVRGGLGGGCALLEAYM